jgi:hypothetical protein
VVWFEIGGGQRLARQASARSKSDINDAQWLAILARSGLLKSGFVPPWHFREYRLIARQLQKLTGIATGERNRLHKLLTDADIRFPWWSAICPANRLKPGSRDY